jgi:hypothetical protein
MPYFKHAGFVVESAEGMLKQTLEVWSCFLNGLHRNRHYTTSLAEIFQTRPRCVVQLNRLPKIHNSLYRRSVSCSISR